MKYKFVYMTYSDSALSFRQNVKAEPAEFNQTLDNFAKQGWDVKQGGAIATERGVLFWALLRRGRQNRAKVVIGFHQIGIVPLRNPPVNT